MAKQIHLILFMICIALAEGCGGGNQDNPSSPASNTNVTYDVNAKGIPKFVGVDYIKLGKILRISKFRSGIGHDYSDGFESCRSMKHYFEPKANADWSTVKVYSPVEGTVSGFTQESAGTQVSIQSKEYPAFYLNIFHINLASPLKVGDPVGAGQQLGTHIGSQTMSDIAVGVNTPSGRKLLSWFDVISDPVFQQCQPRGLVSRTDAIISKQARDADPLSCNGEAFTNAGNLGNWVNLN